MKDYEINRKIQDIMMENGYELVSQERTSSKFRKAYAEFEISFEMCVCHGGRLTISDSHTNNWHRIEHECYDKSLGITDPESELLWEIENEMLPIVNEFFSHMTFKVTLIDRYIKGKEETCYFSTEKEAFDFITENEVKNEDLHTFEKTTIDFPNEECHLEVERIYKEQEHNWDKNRYWFKFKRTNNNWKTFNEYEGYISIFEK